MPTFRGAVDGAAPTATGPRGRARWRKDSASVMVEVERECEEEEWLAGVISRGPFFVCLGCCREAQIVCGKFHAKIR